MSYQNQQKALFLLKPNLNYESSKKKRIILLILQLLLPYQYKIIKLINFCKYKVY